MSDAADARRAARLAEESRRVFMPVDEDLVLPSDDAPARARRILRDVDAARRAAVAGGFIPGALRREAEASIALDRDQTHSIDGPVTVGELLAPARPVEDRPDPAADTARRQADHLWTSNGPLLYQGDRVQALALQPDTAAWLAVAANAEVARERLVRLYGPATEDPARQW